MAPSLEQPHSAELADAWKDLVIRTFGWREHDEFVRVPSLLGRPTLSYLPLLNYTDLGREQAKTLAESAAGRPHLIRALDPGGRFQPGAPVTLRLGLARRSEDQVWKESLSAKCRNQVRKADKSPIATRSGRDPALIHDFYSLLARTLHHYGAPILPRTLFEAMPGRVETTYYLTYHQDRPIAGLVAVADGALSWVPWAASDRAYLRFCPNHQAYWRAIRDTLERGAEVFDFGRSPYGGNTYRFKVQWGAEPLAISLLTHHQANVYSKYRLAQRFWQMAPETLVDRLGPHLCRFLADY